MTINDAITLADSLKPNMMADTVKIRFLNEIEGKIFHEILMKHEHDDEMECPEYDDETERSTELLVGAPYDMVYVYWMICQIDHLNMEMDKYNNDRALFENAWGNFADYWNREVMPLSARPYIRI